MSEDNEVEVGTQPAPGGPAEPKKPVVILAFPDDEPESERAIREAMDLVWGEPVPPPRPRPKGWSNPGARGLGALHSALILESVLDAGRLAGAGLLPALLAGSFVDRSRRVPSKFY